MRVHLGILVLASSVLSCLDVDSLTRGYPPDFSQAPPEPDLKAGSCSTMCDSPLCKDHLDCLQGYLGHGVYASPVCAMGHQPQGPALYQGLTDLKTCSGCKCQVECGGQVAQHGSADVMCAMAATKADTVAQDECVNLAPMTGAFKLILGSSKCSYSGPPVKPDVEYQARVRLCLPPGVRVCDTLSCVRSLSGQSCVLLSGADRICPDGFSGAGVYYQGNTDPRKCDCCKPGPTCGRLTLYNQAACGGADTGMTSAVNACSRLGTTRSAKLSLAPEACTSQVVGNGDPVLSGPVTICCVK